MQQTTESAAVKRHFGSDQSKHIRKAYLTAAGLSNKIIVSNEITGYENKIPVFILADEDRGPV